MTIEANKRIACIIMPFTKKIIAAIILYNVGAMSTYNVSFVIKPRYAGINGIVSFMFFVR